MGGGGRKKSSENDFFNISRKKNSKTNSLYNFFLNIISFSKKSGQVNHFLQCHSQKYTDRTSKKYYFFFNQTINI